MVCSGAYDGCVAPIAAWSRALDRVARACAAPFDDSRSLQHTLLDEIRRVVGFDAYAWLLTDPETEVGCAPLADVPCMPELSTLIRLKYLTPVNRWTTLEVPVARLRAATGDHPEQSLLWRELLVRYGVTDVASMVFRCRYGCWGFLDLWRSGAGGSFTDAEAELLAATARPIAESLRRSQARTFAMTSASAARGGPVVLVLSPDLEVRAQTTDTDEYLRALVPPGVDRQPIPAGAYNVAAQLLSVEAGIDAHRPSARVHLSAGVWVTLRAARMARASTGVDPDIAVTIETTVAAERVTLFARGCALSAREQELLGHLVGGADTHQIAERMFLSDNTVQDHLKSIFAKTGTRSRRGLIVRAAGQ